MNKSESEIWLRPLAEKAADVAYQHTDRNGEWSPCYEVAVENMVSIPPRHVWVRP